MDKFQKEYIALIQAAFGEKTHVLSSDFDWSKAVGTAKKHNIAALVFYGAVNCNVSLKSEHMQELHRQTLHSLMVSERQVYEIEQIESVFEKEHIEHMPLKGALLKPLYPRPEMRTMGDADILIRLEQYPQVEKIMQELGFVYQYESDHELVWRKPSLFLELHKSIMTTYNKDFYGYFGTGWDIAHNVPGTSRYVMTPEDFYLYIFVHFTKHYRISGIGIKHLLDLWVYTKANPDLDWDYVTRELEEMRLAEFHKNVTATVDVWFNGREATDVTDLITNVIFNSGQYGTAEMTMVNRALQKGKKSALGIKLDKVLQGLFPPFKTMQEKYAILKKAPILLPIMWVVRCFDVLFCQTGRLKRYMRRVNQVDAQKIDENKRALYAVGLEFPEGE